MPSFWKSGALQRLLFGDVVHGGGGIHAVGQSGGEELIGEETLGGRAQPLTAVFGESRIPMV
jgi:hypothetical protein